ncbi:unnamed protein product [Rotaria magnacalcarata]
MQDSYSVSAAMEKLVHLTSQPYHQLDIRAALSTEIKKAHQASGKFSKISTHVLDTIDANMSEQLENRLQEAKNNYTGERIVLILCNMGSFHWIGILLGFNIDGCIWRAQSFDPVTGSDHLTDKIQTAFSKVYPDIILRVNTLLKHKDHTKSAILTIANLLIATDDAQFSQRNSLNGQQLNSSYDGGRQNNKNKMDQVQAYPTSNEGNISEYDELEKQVAARLKSFNITDIEILPEKIRRSEQRVKDFREDGRHDDAAKEEKHMSELKEMQILSQRITKLKTSMNSGDEKLRELEQSLASRQAKLKITDLSVLPEKIRRSEQRVKDFREDGRHDDAAKEEKHMSELKEMQALSENIAKLKASINCGDGKLRELEQSLASRQAKLKITDLSVLPEKIRRSEQRVKDFREDGRHDDAAKEEKHMSELKEMQALSENIAKLKASINCGDGKLRELEQSLASRQAKLKITDLSVLPQKIRHSQERVKDFQDDGRHDDAEKESKHLSDLKEMLTLSQKITKLKASKDSGEGQLIALEESLTNSKIKLKITDLTVLPEKIRRTEERVKDFRDDGRNDDADKETKYLCELKELQALSEKIAQLKNTMNSSEWKLCQLEKSLLSNQEKLNITDLAVLPEKIRRSEQRAKDFRDDGRNDDAERETRFLSDLKELLALSENITKLKSSGSNCDSQSVTLEERLANIKARFNITDLSVLSEKILRSEQRIKDFRDDGRNDDAEKETKYVDELKELQELGKRKDDLKLPNTQSEVTIDSSASKQAEEKIESSSTKTDKLVLTDLDTLHQDLLFLPVCAEKVAMQLLEYFQQIMASQNKSVTFSNSSVYQLFDELENQMDQEEMLSDTVRKNLQDLRRYVDNQDASSANRCLAELLKKIRPLHVQEIQRLIDKAKAAAKVIEDQDVILLIGETGTGKSTTIQFLAGCQMEKKKVEVENGRFLEHVEAVEPIKNPELRRIISSPRNKSETRYITPVTVPLRDIFGPHETGEFIICDAPGFGDTAGPEVDIANGVGVIEAIRGCKSVKILLEQCEDIE